MKMKIATSLFAAALMATASVNAQSSAQIRAGLNLANVSVTDNGRVDDAKTLTSFQVGLIGDIALGSVFSFQPGVVFTGKGSKTQNGDPNSSSGSWFRATSNPYYVEIPANFVFKAPIGSGTRFFVGAGPYLAVGVGGKNKVEGRTILGTSYERESSIEFSDDDPTTLSEEEGAGLGLLKRFDYGLNGTAGIEGRSIVLGVGYGLGLAKLQSGANNSANDDNKHRVWSVTLGFKL